MAIDTSIPRTRRALLAGGIGGMAALAASALGRPLPVAAADGDVVHVGDEVACDSVTRIVGTSSAAIWGESQHAYGVQGTSWASTGVIGKSHSGFGVVAASVDSFGIDGLSDAATKAAIVGRSGADGTAIIGITGCNFDHRVPDSIWDPSPPKTGVYGYAAQDAFARGVYGRTTSGQGVYGEATNGRGVSGVSQSGTGVVGTSVSGFGVAGESAASHAVHGATKTGYGVFGTATSGRGGYFETTSGQGVRGYATTGTAGYFSTATPTSGYALRAVGRVRLDKCAGLATIAAGSDRVTVSPGIDLVSTSAVVATLQGNAGSTSTAVSRVTVNPTTNTFTIILTKAATLKVNVAWIVLG